MSAPLLEFTKFLAEEIERNYAVPNLNLIPLLKMQERATQYLTNICMDVTLKAVFPKELWLLPDRRPVQLELDV